MTKTIPFGQAALDRSRAAFGEQVECSVASLESPPLFIQPRDARLRDDMGAFAQWFSAHRDAFEQALLDHGAVVVRGFPVKDTAAFQRALAHMTPYRHGYVAGAAPRKQIVGQVMESTRAAPHRYIFLHQEMAYMATSPRVIVFYCRVAPATGGATPIGDVRRVTALLPQPLLRKLDDKGIHYIRNLLPPDLVDEKADMNYSHKSWAESFGTTDRAEVTQACESRGLAVRWLDNGCLEVSTRLPAIIDHPATGDRIYFSQAHGFASAETPADGRARPYVATFGDGEALADTEVKAIHKAFADATVRFDWQPGDIMFVENKLTAHGREPYTGDRDIQVALLD